ncbi:MAG: CTP synthase (glutamine hydrolyzing) [Candidatus Micrarchaeota archaeon]|nr:CTP synthase (glutamine hydrolyzing) [Candidatus Micrarchaeota archaeon]
MPTKYVVVLGTLMSGLGKGVATSSILRILDFYGFRVFPIKFDGYLNYDCGTMNPYRHGEVFVLDDKSEVDMDFGIYERFLNKDLTGDLSITGGKLFSIITTKERRGDYLGEDVQMIPHLTNEIIGKIERIAESKKPDVMVIEVGGTVGDIENSYFIEAMRQFSLKHKTVFVNLTYVPTIDAVGEQKTKPAQIGFRLLLQAGIVPNYILCRSPTKLLEKTKEKLSLFGNVGIDRIVDDSDQPTLYNLPLHLMEQGFDRMLIKDLGLREKPIDRVKLAVWKDKVAKIIKPRHSANIAIVGKYTTLKDSYASVKEALIHAGSAADTRINIKWVESSSLEKDDLSEEFNGISGMVVTGGFGLRGTEGMINAARYARESGMPYLGICLGMQLMTVEYARNVCGLKDANSSEFDPGSRHKVIDLIESQRGIKQKGGTMRLGSQRCIITDKESIAYKLYGKSSISERHRHRYEFNNSYRKLLQGKGLRISAVTPDRRLVEAIEWTTGFGIGMQAHPELKSRLEVPSPPFIGLVQEALKFKR